MKLLVFSAVVLGVVAYGYFGIYITDQNKAEAEFNETKLVNETLEQISSLKFVDGEKVKSFVKIDDDWMVKEPFQDRADQQQVSNIVKAILATRYEKKLFSKSETFERNKFGLEGQVKTIVLGTSSGEVYEFEFGTIETYDGSSYVFSKSKEELLVVDKQIIGFFAKPAFDLRDKALVDIAKDDVNLLKVNWGESVDVELSKSDEKWNLKGESERLLAPEEIRRYVEKVTDLRIVEFVSENKDDLKKFFLDKPMLRVSVNGVEYSFGKKSVDEKFGFVMSTNKKFIGRVYGNLIEDLKIKRDDFLDLNYLFKVKREGVAKIKVQAKTPVEYAREGADWVKKGLDGKIEMKINQAQIDSLLNRIVNLKGVSLVDSKRFQEPSGAVEVFSGENNLMFKLEWGKQFSENLGPSVGKEEYIPVRTSIGKNDIVAIPKRDIEPFEKGLYAKTEVNEENKSEK